MNKHTPGPWRLELEGSLDWTIREPSGKSVMGETSYYPWQSDNIMDAHLIAAAPELLEALKAMLPENNSSDEHHRPGFETCELARAAIAKAEGRR